MSRAALKFIPLHALFEPGRPAASPVCRDGQRLVSWQEFSGRVAALTAQFAARPEPRWLLASDDTLSFAIRLLGLLYAGKQVVIPPNAQAGTLATLADTFDARCGDFETAAAGAPGVLPAIDPATAIIEL